MPVDYALLQTLVAVSTAPSFAAAATRLRMSTSAISQRIKQLEHQLGFPLFERIGRQNHLTTAARELLGIARDCFTPLDETVQRLRGDHGELRGLVRIGGPPPFSRLWLRPRLAALKKRHPEILPEVQYDTSWALSPRLAAGEMDLCIIVGPINVDAGLASQLIYTEEFVAVAAPAYLKAHGKPRSELEFSARPFVVFDANMAMLTPWWRTHFGRRSPLPANHACRIANLDEMLALTEAGVGISVLPSFFVEESLSRKATVLVQPPRVPGKAQRRSLYPIHLAWRKTAIETARFRVVRELLLR